MEVYLLKSTAILAIFWMLYVFFLEKENMHHFKRFYLLTSMVSAFCIPIISITEYVYVNPGESFQFTNNFIPLDFEETQAAVDLPFWTLNTILLTIYILGACVFSIRFFRNIFKMVKTISINETQKHSTITYVLLKQFINPHTFFNFIFLNKVKYQKNEVPDEVLLHEETHAKQKHSLDIVFIELLQIIFWFQPLIWLYKKRIKLNHEFLADQAVLDSGFESTNYQTTLLNYSSHQNYSLSNAINYSSIKKRFTVMKTQTSRKKKWLFSLLVLPILGLLFFSFSEREIVKIEANTEQKIEQQKPPTVTEIAEYNAIVKSIESESVKFSKNATWYPPIDEKKYIRISSIYKRMSSEQKKNAKEFPYVKPDLETKKDDISILVNGKNCEPCELSKSELLNLNLSSNTGAMVKSFAIKLVGFPTQGNKGNLLNTKTKAIVSQYKSDSPAQILNIRIEGIEGNFNKLIKIKEQNPPTAKEISAYNTWAKKMKAKFKTMSDSEKVNGYPHMINDETFRYHNAIFDRMSKTQKDKAESLPEAVLVTEWPMPTAIVVDQVSSQQKLPTKKEVEEYNAWAKKLKKETLKAQENERKGLTAEYPIVKQKNLIRYVSIYKRMTPQQKANSLELPIADEELKNTGLKFPPPPPPQQKPLTTKEITNYNTWAKEFNQKIKKAEQNKDYYDYPIIKLKDLNLYKTIYSRMSDKQKENAERFPNIPPPPPPPAPATPQKSKSKGGPNNYNIVFKDDTDDSVEAALDIKTRDYRTRYLILKVSQNQTKRIKYFLNHKESNVNEINTYIKNNRKVDVTFNSNTLHFFDNNTKEMTEQELEKVYKQLFVNYKNEGNTIVVKKMPEKKENCLEIPKSFITKKGNTFNIKCIDEYPENKLQIFNRWGNLIYSKDNYNNSWNGKVDKDFAEEGSDKPISGTYYYVIDSPKLDKQKVGYLIIDTEKSTLEKSNTAIEDYKKKYKAYKKFQDKAPHYINKSNSEKLKMEALFSDLGGMYFRLSKANKRLVERPIAPIMPYVKITLKGKTYYKKSNELTDEERATLPPPPPSLIKKDK